MESFSIACTTCQVRLRVRDPSAIGQILTCPKCGSMVLVESPEGEAKQAAGVSPPPRPQPQSATAAAKDEVIAEAAREPAPENMADTVEDLSLYGTRPAEGTQPLETGQEQAALGGEELDEPLLPTDDWTSPETRQWRNSLLVAAAAITGIGLAVGLFAVVSMQLSGDSRQAAAISTAEPASTVLEPPAFEPPTDVETPPPTAELPAPEVPQGEPPLAGTPPVEGPVAEAEPAAPGEPRVADDATVPPGFTPREAATDGDGGPDTVTKTLREFEALLDEPPPPLADLDDPDQALGDETAGVDAAEEDVEPRPEPHEVDVAERLGDTFQEIVFDETPLTDFLHFVSQFSTVPITLHPESLVWLKITPLSRTSVAMKEGTVADLLTEGLRPLGLGFAVQDDTVLVGRPSATADGSLRRVPFDISDLAHDDEARASLAARIVDLIASDSWSANGGEGTIVVDEGTLVIEQQDEILFETLFFLEKLRVARGLSPRSRFDAALFQLIPRSARGAAKLEQPVSLNYLRPTPFVKIVERIGKETGTHLLIDWQALQSSGWRPDSAVPFQVAGQPLREALAILLEPMGLTYRVVDATTFQITTPARAESLVELEFYPAGKLLAEMTADELAERLQSALAMHSEATATLRVDRASQCLVAAAPQSTQIAIAKVLASW